MWPLDYIDIWLAKREAKRFLKNLGFEALEDSPSLRNVALAIVNLQIGRKQYVLEYQVDRPYERDSRPVARQMTPEYKKWEAGIESVDCSSCNGTGQGYSSIGGGDSCNTCNGSGRSIIRTGPEPQKSHFEIYLRAVPKEGK